MKKFLVLSFSFCGWCLLSACGGGGGPVQPAFGPIASFFISPPATVTAGTAFSVTVTAHDAAGHSVSNYSGNLKVTTTDGQATLPNSPALANGTVTFQLTFKTATSQTITAVDAATGLISGSSTPVNVNCGPASSFSFTTPQRVTTGITF